MHTHARRIVQRFIQKQLGLIHTARRELLCAAVSAAVGGHFLSLSRLARALMGESTQRAALKRVDRLIGNPRIGEEARVVGAALLRVLCRGGQPLLIAVDWSAVCPGGAFVELRAALTWLGMGRGLTIYQQVYPESKLGNGRAERALLDTLHGWIPAGVEVIIVTDAGFRRPWFTHVERLGWSWIGRIRAGVCVSRDQTHWEKATAWFAKATGKACRWSECWLTRKHRFACDMVLYRRRVGGASAMAERVTARPPKHGARRKRVPKSRGCSHTRRGFARIVPNRSWRCMGGACRSRRISATANRQTWAWGFRSVSRARRCACMRCFWSEPWRRFCSGISVSWPRPKDCIAASRPPPASPANCRSSPWPNCCVPYLDCR